MWSQQLLPTPTPSLFPLFNPQNAPFSQHVLKVQKEGRVRAISADEICPNAARRKREPDWRGGFSLGVDLGMSRTGVALSKVMARNATVEQSSSVAGRLAVRAAYRGWRVYLLDEHGTTQEAVDRMINMGLTESARQNNSDAYAAMVISKHYSSAPWKQGRPNNLKNIDWYKTWITMAPQVFTGSSDVRNRHCLESSPMLSFLLHPPETVAPGFPKLI
uniref:YqgF/RNase H-like domain-containing protein n=1 Tax=Cannabis sativa TaxID=3483 RepID=A0A803NVV5_CANSA